MPANNECPVCGNARPLLGICPFCETSEPPTALNDVTTINIERGKPTIDDALDRLTQYLRALEDIGGIKAVIVIHGYGSSGKGGGIRTAVRQALDHAFYADRVSEYYFGEDLGVGSSAFHSVIKRRPNLKDHLRLKAGNPGMTLLLLG